MPDMRENAGSRKQRRTRSRRYAFTKRRTVRSVRSVRFSLRNSQVSCEGMDFWIQDVVTTWTLESFAVTKQKVDHLWRTPVKHKHHCASLRNFTYSQYGLKTWKAEKGNHCMYGYETGTLQRNRHALGQLFNLFASICTKKKTDTRSP